MEVSEIKVTETTCDTQVDKHCGPCSLDDVTVTAEGYCRDCNDYLCANCFSCHTKPRPLRNHRLVSIRDLIALALESGEGAGTVVEAEVKAGADVCVEKCKLHTNETVSFYCRIHEILGCGACMMHEHRQCRTYFIPTATSTEKTADEIQTFNDELKNLENHFNVAFETANIFMTKSKETFDKAMKDFQSFKKEMYGHLDKTEKYIENMAGAIRDVNVSQMMGVAEKCKTYREQANVIFAEKNSLDEKGLKCQSFIYRKRAKPNIEMLQKEKTAMEALVIIDDYKFEALVAMPEEGKHFGRLQINSDDGKYTAEKHQKSKIPDVQNSSTAVEDDNPDVKWKEERSTEVEPFKTTLVAATFLQSIVIKKPDNQSCDTSAIAVLPDKRLVIVDRANLSIKLIDPVQNVIQHELKIRYLLYNTWEPFDVTSLGDNHLAVTWPEKKKIYHINVEKTLVESKSMTVGGHCYSILYDESRQVCIVTFCDPPAVRMLDFQGAVIKTLVGQSEAKELFQRPIYAAMSRDNMLIYISDCVKNTVTSIHINGHVTSVFGGGFFMPTGVSVGYDGHVYVCDMAQDRVHRLSPDLKGVQVLLDNEKMSPQGVACSKDDNALFVYGSNETLKVFSLITLIH